MSEVWDLWYPNAAAQGLPFARGRLNHADVVLVHAAPDTLTVAVRDDGGALLARGENLRRTADTPMLRLTRQGDQLAREDVWPAPADIGRPVILAGGEVGILCAWWNAPDGSAWRWSVEFFNRR
jgi:hypothetical protein